MPETVHIAAVWTRPTGGLAVKSSGTYQDGSYVDRWLDMVRRKAPQCVPLLITDSPDKLPNGVDHIDCRPFVQEFGVSAWWPSFLAYHPQMCALNMLMTGLDQVLLEPVDVFLNPLPSLMTYGRSWGWNNREDFGPYHNAMAYLPAWAPGREEVWKRWAETCHKAFTEQFDEARLNAILAELDERLIETWPDRLVASYKCAVGSAPCKYQDPGFHGIAALCFHGYPKPHDVINNRMEGWGMIRDAWCPPRHGALPGVGR